MLRRLFFALVLSVGMVSLAQAAPTVTLNITAGTNAVSHTIQKSTNGGAFSVLTTVNMPTVVYVDTAVAIGNAYCYQAKTNSNVDSSPFSPSCCQTLNAAGTPSLTCTVAP